MIPTYVVIPVKRGEREKMTANLIRQLGTKNVLVDDTPDTLTRKWNDGLRKAAALAESKPHNVAILNNDLEVPPWFLDKLAVGIRCHADNWISYPDIWSKQKSSGSLGVVQYDPMGPSGQTMAGYAFMVRGEAGLRFDERFQWWYADADIEKQTRAAGKRVVSVIGCYCNHLHPCESTFTSPALMATAYWDEIRFAKKWHLDQGGLFLTTHYPDKEVLTSAATVVN